VERPPLWNDRLRRHLREEATTGAGGGSSAAGGATNAGGSSSAAGGATNAGGSNAPGGGIDGGDGAGGTTSTGVTVQLDQTQQTIEGFGLNTALGGGSFPGTMLFTTTGADGIGLSIVRVGMNSDGSLSGDLSGAKSRNVKVIGSVWTAPANWKDNNNDE
jgi:hypothetical protein